MRNLAIYQIDFISGGIQWLSDEGVAFSRGVSGSCLVWVITAQDSATFQTTLEGPIDGHLPRLLKQDCVSPSTLLTLWLYLVC